MNNSLKQGSGDWPCQEKQTPRSEQGPWKSAIKVRGEKTSAVIRFSRKV